MPCQQTSAIGLGFLSCSPEELGGEMRQVGIPRKTYLLRRTLLGLVRERRYPKTDYAFHF